MRGAVLKGVVLGAAVAAASAAAAADLPRHRHRAPPRDHVIYAPRGPVEAVVVVPPYRVIYQTPSPICGLNDFCTAAFGL